MCICIHIYIYICNTYTYIHTYIWQESAGTRTARQTTRFWEARQRECGNPERLGKHLKTIRHMLVSCITYLYEEQTKGP